MRAADKFLILVPVFFTYLVLGGYVIFWLTMLFASLREEDASQRKFWWPIIVFIPTGAVVYYFARYRATRVTA